MATVAPGGAAPAINGHEPVKTSKLSKGQLRKLKAKQKKEQEQHQPASTAAGETNGAATDTVEVKKENGAGAEAPTAEVKREESAQAVKTESGNMYDDMADDEDVSAGGTIF